MCCWCGWQETWGHRAWQGSRGLEGGLGHMPWISAQWEWGSRPWYHAVYELGPQVTGQIHSSHGKKSSWTPSGSTTSLQENPHVTPRDAFGEGWRAYSMSGMEVQAAGLSHQQRRALWEMDKERHHDGPGQQTPSSTTATWVTLGVTGAYTSINPPRSFSSTLAPPQQSHPLWAALSSPEAADHFFWPCEPVQTEINTPLKRAGPSWYFILMAKKPQANNYEVPLVCRSFSNMFPTWFSQAYQRGQTWSW